MVEKAVRKSPSKLSDHSGLGIFWIFVQIIYIFWELTIFRLPIFGNLHHFQAFFGTYQELKGLIKRRGLPGWSGRWVFFGPWLGSVELMDFFLHGLDPQGSFFTIIHPAIWEKIGMEFVSKHRNMQQIQAGLLVGKKIHGIFWKKEWEVQTKTPFSFERDCFVFFLQVGGGVNVAQEERNIVKMMNWLWSIKYVDVDHISGSSHLLPAACLAHTFSTYGRMNLVNQIFRLIDANTPRVHEMSAALNRCSLCFQIYF